MIAYVESNFLLEIALGRENETAARRILELAEQGDVEVVVPVFALCEPYSTVNYRARKRAQEFRAVERQLDDLARGDANRELVDAMAPRLTDILDVEIRERTELDAVAGRLLGTATVVQLSVDVFTAAQQHQRTHGLDASDALIYASVLAHAATRPQGEEKVFVTRNSSDFDRDAIRQELAIVETELSFSFVELAGLY